MSRELCEKTTVAELLDKLPKTGEADVALLTRTDEDKEADLKYYVDLFEGIDSLQISGILLYTMQILKGRDPDATHFLLECSKTLIEEEYPEVTLPAPIKTLVKLLREGRDNS